MRTLGAKPTKQNDHLCWGGGGRGWGGGSLSLSSSRWGRGFRSRAPQGAGCRPLPAVQGSLPASVP